MNAISYLVAGWSWNPLLLLGCVAAVVTYAKRFRSRGRPGFFVAALVVVLIALSSPLNELANGVLFSAHMTQHILLLLVVPALGLLSLPRHFDFPGSSRRGVAAMGWIGGVGSMWFWHMPVLCDAAASHPGVHVLQSGSLLVMGAAFWWPIVAPRERDRVLPGVAVAYLFTACIACTALGIILTLTPIEVCTAFQAPIAGSPWAAVRDRFTTAQDQQIGGLLMWIPMCLVYLAAIMFELGRWHRMSASQEDFRP